MNLEPRLVDLIVVINGHDLHDIITQLGKYFLGLYSVRHFLGLLS